MTTKHPAVGFTTPSSRFGPAEPQGMKLAFLGPIYLRAARLGYLSTRLW